MNYAMLEEAHQFLGNKQLVINMVSRRVRQLSSGARPHVLVEPRMTFADTAMAEILAGKLVARPRTELSL